MVVVICKKFSKYLDHWNKSYISHTLNIFKTYTFKHAIPSNVLHFKASERSINYQVQQILCFFRRVLKAFPKGHLKLLLNSIVDLLVTFCENFANMVRQYYKIKNKNYLVILISYLLKYCLFVFKLYIL